MSVGSTGNDSESAGRDACGEHLRIPHDLLNVFPEFLRSRFLETHRLGSDDVDQRPTLHLWKNRPIQILCERFATENDSASWTAERFVRRAGDKLRVRDRGRMFSGRDQ